MIHLEKYNLDELPNISKEMVVIAWCGERATIADDGRPDPPDFDFVTKAWPDNATCPACIGEHNAQRPDN